MMSKLTVNVPTATRPAVARNTLQTALNRSVPAVTDEIDRSIYTYPSQVKNPRIAPTSTTTTNEFGTKTPLSPGRREPAETKIVDFGRNVQLNPRGKFNVRGVGSDGFFPPVKLRTGASGVRFSTSAGSVRSCKSAHQTPSSPAASSPLMNVELAPAKTQRTTTGSESASPPGRSSTDEWMPSARSENIARTHMLQDKPANPYNTRAVLAASRETFTLKDSSPSPSQKAFSSAANMTGQRTASQGQTRSSKDAAWVRSFKVKQRRHNRVKEILESKPTGLGVGPPSDMDNFR